MLENMESKSGHMKQTYGMTYGMTYGCAQRVAWGITDPVRLTAG